MAAPSSSTICWRRSHFVFGVVAIVLTLGSARFCNAQLKEEIYNTLATEEDGGGFGNKWADMTAGDNTVRDYFSDVVGDDNAAGLYSLKLEFNQCPWRYWTAFALHSINGFIAKENNFLFFRWAGNARAFSEMIIELESPDKTISEVKVPTSVIDVPGNTDDLNKPWYLSMPLSQFMGIAPDDKFNRVSFKVKYVDPEAVESVEYYMSDIFIGTIEGTIEGEGEDDQGEGDGSTVPDVPMDSRNWNVFGAITDKDVIYDGDSAIEPFYVSEGWRDWSWGALMPRDWNVKWKTSENWVKNVVSVGCDNAEPQAMTLMSNAGIQVDAATVLYFKYFGDWSDVSVLLQNKNDATMDTVIPLNLASYPLPTGSDGNWPFPSTVPSGNFEQAEIPLADAANAQKYNLISFVREVGFPEQKPVCTSWDDDGVCTSYDGPVCTSFGSTNVFCQTVYIADLYTE